MKAFVVIDTRNSLYVTGYKFTEMGWSVKKNRSKFNAKVFKTLRGAENAARQIGNQYTIASIEAYWL